MPVSTIPTSALALLPDRTVTVLELDGIRDAGLPICLPLAVTADTPG